MFHAVFIIDSGAARVGDDISEGCYANKNALVKVFNEVFSGPRDGRFKHYVLDGNSASPSYLKFFFEEHMPKEVVRGVDTLFVSYCGHGTQHQDGKHEFAMSNGSILRSDLRTYLLTAGARLSVLHSDTCSSYPGQVAFPARNVPAKWKGFEALFFDTSGLVDITAARPGEFAWSTSEGGFFSRTFTRLLCEDFDNLDTDSDGTLTWKEFFGKVRAETDKLFDEVKANSSPNSKIRGSNAQLPTHHSLGPMEWERRLKIVNDRSDTLCFWAKVRAYNSETRQWVWTSVARWEIEPGKTTYLHQDGWGVKGNAFVWWGSNLRGTVKYGNKNTTLTFLDPTDANEGIEDYVLRFAD